MYLITGGAGFIGSALIWHLNNMGIRDVVVVDFLGTDDKWRNLVTRDIVDVISPKNWQTWLSQHSRKLKGIAHMGACSSTTETNADFLIKNNVHESMEYFKVCTNYRVPLIYASSAATYGAREKQFYDTDETTKSLKPINKYGYSKHLFDKWALQQNCHPPKWAGLKFFNVYGPNEYHKGAQASVALHAYPQVNENGILNLFKSYRQEFSDGEQRRDFVYIKDVVKVISHFLLSEESFENGLYNVGTGEASSFNELAAACFKAVNKKTNIAYIEMPETLRAQYQYSTEADLSKLRAEGKYQDDFTPLEEGVLDYYNNYIGKGKQTL